LRGEGRSLLEEFWIDVGNVPNLFGFNALSADGVEALSVFLPDDFHQVFVDELRCRSYLPHLAGDWIPHLATKLELENSLRELLIGLLALTAVGGELFTVGCFVFNAGVLLLHLRLGIVARPFPLRGEGRRLLEEFRADVSDVPNFVGGANTVSADGVEAPGVFLPDDFHHVLVDELRRWGYLLHLAGVRIPHLAPKLELENSLGELLVGLLALAAVGGEPLTVGCFVFDAGELLLHPRLGVVARPLLLRGEGHCLLEEFRVDVRDVQNLVGDNAVSADGVETTGVVLSDDFHQVFVDELRRWAYLLHLAGDRIPRLAPKLELENSLG